MVYYYLLYLLNGGRYDIYIVYGLYYNKVTVYNVNIYIIYTYILMCVCMRKHCELYTVHVNVYHIHKQKVQRSPIATFVNVVPILHIVLLLPLALVHFW